MSLSDELNELELVTIRSLVHAARTEHDAQLKLLGRKHKLTGVDESSKQYHHAWSNKLTRILDKLDKKAGA